MDIPWDLDWRHPKRDLGTHNHPSLYDRIVLLGRDLHWNEICVKNLNLTWLDLEILHKWTDRQRNKHTHTDTHRDTHTHTHTHTDTDRHLIQAIALTATGNYTHTHTYRHKHIQGLTPSQFWVPHTWKSLTECIQRYWRNVSDVFNSVEPTHRPCE